MKVALITLALVSMTISAPQPKKIFHEHYDDFVNLIGDTVGDQLIQLADQYFQSEEYQKTIEFMETAEFKNLVYEMESLPEFKALIDFLENHNIDISYFIDTFNNLLEGYPRVKKMRQGVVPSGNDFKSFMEDCINLFPKDKLAALFNEKIEQDEQFKNAIDSLNSQEFADIVVALQDNQVFAAEMKTLADNGILFSVILDQLIAIFGQN